MFQYLVKRFAMMIPTFFGITLLSFIIINLAPGSPIEQKIQAARFGGMGARESSGGGVGGSGSAVSQEVIESMKKQYGFDKPVHVRYFIWLKNIFKLDFGQSFKYEEPVVDVVMSKLPVSLQFGILSFLLTYLVCIPLGIFKAVKDGSYFDFLSSAVLFVMYSIPPVMLAILLIVTFGGGSFLDWFPISGIKSDAYDTLTTFGKFLDRAHHFVLPMICYMIGSFTFLTFLMKNSLIDEIKLDYIRTARAKGLPENKVYFKHALRNALIPIATGIGNFLGVFFAGSIIIEQIFQLDGMGLLSFNSLLSRDYNVIMFLIFFQSVVLLFGRLISDMTYVLIDPRIDFN